MATISASSFVVGLDAWGLSMLVRSCQALRQASSTKTTHRAGPGRNAQIVCPNAAQPAYALAAMLACARAAERRMTRNWDGFQLVSNLPGIPLTYPDVADQLNDSAANQARTTYFMTPLIVRSGNFQVQEFTTTYGGTLPFWSVATTHAAWRTFVKSSWRRLRCLVAKSSFDSRRRCRRMCSIRNR